MNLLAPELVKYKLYLISDKTVCQWPNIVYKL